MPVRDNSPRIEYGNRGLLIGDRLAVFFPTPGVRGLNVAMTREGGLTQRLMAGMH